MYTKIDLIILDVKKLNQRDFRNLQGLIGDVLSATLHRTMIIPLRLFQPIVLGLHFIFLIEYFLYYSID